ncbi:unnamed protein product [Cylindrotheca closterium]|uniref:Uncharacterized protein n=1 Tax=Cylindrotheca closterium TaxID=2856 RepID=A0AAD2FEM4_9STRA|nr:unnamed protein product [Cylindrotheca closterium]
MTDPFENCSPLLRMRQGGFLKEGKIHDGTLGVLKFTTSSLQEVAYESVDNYPAILRMRERRDPINSLEDSESSNAPLVKDNTMVRGCRQRSDARTPYYEDESSSSNSNDRGSDSETATEEAESDKTESNNSSESSNGSTFESLPNMRVPTGRTQPNLIIPSAMSLEDENNKYAFADPIQEISITESNILESFSMHSYSRCSRDTFDDDEDEKGTETPPRRAREEKNIAKTPSSPLEASIMAMDAYYKNVLARPTKQTIDPRIEEMKQIMLVFWKQDQTSATALFSISWQLSRRYLSIAASPAQPEHVDNSNAETSLIQYFNASNDDPLWRSFQRFFANQGTIIIPQYLCPSSVEDFMIFDWGNEIEGMESDEISDSYGEIDELLTVDRVLSLEDFDDDEIFKFRNFIEAEDKHSNNEVDNDDDGDIHPTLSGEDGVFEFRGCVNNNHYVFESQSSSMANHDSNIAQPAAYEPFSKLEKIVEEVSSNAETESNATSVSKDDGIRPAINDDADPAASPTQATVEKDSRSTDSSLFPDSLDNMLMMIPNKSVVDDGAISVEESQDDTFEQSHEDAENNGDWGNAYSSSAKHNKMTNMPIEAAFDMAIKGVRSIHSENNSTKEVTRRGTKDGSLRSRDALSVASEQTNVTHDCVSENLVDRFLTTLEIALCLR